MDITIRYETMEDFKVIRKLNLAAFETSVEANLVDQMRETPDRDALISLVAVSDKEVIGHALFSPAHVVDGIQTVTIMNLGPIAVLPENQRRGIGTAMIRRGIELIQAAGYPLIVLIGHPTYYPRFGFVPARQHGLECPWPVSDPVFMVREVLPGSLGDIRGMIVYPEPFANL